MNSDQVKGKFEQAVGSVKQAVGETLGNNQLANEGLGDQVKGSAHETWGNVKDAAGISSGTAAVAAEDRGYGTEADLNNGAANARHGISQSIADAKNAINNHIDAYKETHR